MTAAISRLRILSILAFAGFFSLVSTSCGPSETAYQVRDHAEIVSLSRSVISARIADGSLGETTPIFMGGAWGILRNHEVFRSEVEAAKQARLAAARTPAWAAPVATPGAAAGAAEGTATGAATASAAPFLVLNSGNPGEEIDIRAHLVPGRTVIFDFSSEYCGPCVALGPRLEQLAAKRAELVVRKIDINRSGVQGIDWSSPVADQYGLESIPHLKVFDGEGNLKAEGDAASRLVYGWLGEEQIQ